MLSEVAAYWLLLPMAILCIIGAWISYDDKVRFEWWFLVIMGFLGLACSLLWGWACTIVGDKTDLYTFSLWWDGITVAAYYFLPLLICGVRPPIGVLVGAALMVLGLVCVKMFSA